MSRRTSVLIAVGVLALVVALTPLLPRGSDGGAVRAGLQAQRRPAAHLADTAGLGRVTPAMRREIDHVVRRGTVLGARLARRSAAGGLRGKAALVAREAEAGRAVRALVRCADFEGQRYCLGSGWTDQTQAQVQARTASSARRVLARTRSGGDSGERTGDLDAADLLAQRERLSVAERARQDRAELTQAARSVAKVWLLRHDVQGVPLPPDFLAEHPEAAAVDAPAGAAPAAATPAVATPSAIAVSAAPSPTVTPTPVPTVAPTVAPTVTATALPSATPTAPTKTPDKTYDLYPESATVLDKTQVADQERSYWCGPTAMQMLAWGWRDKYRSQQHWATALGTTSAGSSIGKMVQVTNARTGWDRPDYAGPYVALDVQDFTFDQWQLLLMKHIVDLRSPLILHVNLEKQYFPYLDHDGSGHFQVGRGYDKKGDRPDLIGYFEPWNQQRFHPDEPFISRVQWRQSYRTYRATLAHFQHDVGV